jgi:hypothetical protein
MRSLHGECEQLRNLRRLSAAAPTLTATARIAHEGNVLLAVDLKRDWWARAAVHAALDICEFRSVVCAISEEMAIASNLKHEIAGGCENASTPATSTIGAPPLF